MNLVAHAYSKKTECSIQECVYHILSGLWSGFTNNNIPEKRFSIFLSENEISELPEHSTDCLGGTWLIDTTIVHTAHLQVVNFQILMNFVTLNF